MSLFDEHKAERRTKILAAARELVIEHGYDGLTMRDLARAARVSVPTLYNLFGGKDAILVAALESSAFAIAGTIKPSDSYFQRGMAAFELGMRQIEEQPEFYRAVIRMAMTSPETLTIRRRAANAFIAIMKGNLTAAQAAGQLAEWADPEILANHMFAHHMALFLAWGTGEIDWPTFRACTLSGICHFLIGVARGPFAVEVEARLRETLRDPLVRQPFTAPHSPEVSHAQQSRDR
jgi:AcrR family transcriptional regulator